MEPWRVSASGCGCLLVFEALRQCRDKICRIEMVFDVYTQKWVDINVQDADFKNTEQLKFSIDNSVPSTA